MVVLHGGPGAPGTAAGLARSLSPWFGVMEPLQRRSGGAPLTVERHVADLDDVLPEAATLVGHSWGAMLALSFAARRPGRARAIALVGCGTYDEASRALFERTLRERLGARGVARLETLTRRYAAAATATASERDLLFSRLGRLIGEGESFDPEPDEAAGAGRLRVDARGFDETWRDVLRLQREGVEPEIFDRVSVPVLMLHGRQDPHPGPATRDLLQRFIPQLEYVELPACGHEPWRERQARTAFLGILREWIGERRC